MLLLIPSPDTTEHGPAPASEWPWARSADGQRIDGHGQSPAARLPADSETVLVLPPTRVSWHHVHCPKVPAARLRAVLDGLLEDRLLDEPGRVHLALEPGARPGQPLWVAACDATWLRQQLAALQAAGREVDRIVPLCAPQAEPLLGAHEWDGAAWLCASGPQGVLSLPLHADASPSAQQAWLGEDATALPLRAEPGCAALAEQALGRPPAIEPAPQAWLRAAQGPWDLAQFEFSRSAQARRGQRLRELLRQWQHAPAWRPARWGLAALVLVQLAALNLQAWQSRRELAATQAQTRQLLTQTFPRVGLVLDAPVQMRRALADLRQASGEVSGGDLETALQLLAGAQPEFTQLDYRSGELDLRGFRAASPGEAWQDTLRQAGWTVQLTGQPPVLNLRTRP